MINNIDFINNQISFISKKLNEKNINFYIVGAIGAYIDASIPLQRQHNDLDLMIEEKDVIKLHDIFKDTDLNSMTLDSLAIKHLMNTVIQKVIMKYMQNLKAANFTLVFSSIIKIKTHIQYANTSIKTIKQRN